MKAHTLNSFLTDSFDTTRANEFLAFTSPKFMNVLAPLIYLPFNHRISIEEMSHRQKFSSLRVALIRFGWYGFNDDALI